MQTKYEEVNENVYFVNKSLEDVMNSAGNMSSFLSSNMINPWSVNEMSSLNQVKVIKTETKFVYSGLETASKMNVLGLVVFSVAFGAILSGMGEAGRPMTVFFTIMLEVVMKLVTLIIW